MLTDLSEYLSDERKQEIAEEVFREQIGKHLSNERQVSNHLYNITQHVVDSTLEEHLGDWQATLIEKVKGDLRKGLTFYIFRAKDRYSDDKEGVGLKYLRAAVDKHAGRIETQVLKAIDGMGDDSLGYLMRDALAKRLGGGV